MASKRGAKGTSGKQSKALKRHLKKQTSNASFNFGANVSNPFG